MEIKGYAIKEELVETIEEMFDTGNTVQQMVAFLETKGYDGYTADKIVFAIIEEKMDVAYAAYC